MGTSEERRKENQRIAVWAKSTFVHHKN